RLRRSARVDRRARSARRAAAAAPVPLLRGNRHVPDDAVLGDVSRDELSLAADARADRAVLLSARHPGETVTSDGVRRVVALLPMKGHSERVPGKNFRDFCGKPLFRWILDSLLSLPEIGLVVINTDARPAFESL